MSINEYAEEEDAVINTPILSVEEDISVEDRMTKNAVENILPARYLQRDGEGNIIEEPGELFERVAENVAKAEETDKAEAMWADEFQNIMERLEFMPNSPTLMNAGLPLQQLSACFVRSPKDSMTDIGKAQSEAQEIFKSGGGLGYAFSNLRPKGAMVSSTKGESSGPVSFMRIFDETCNQVKQGGKRRGAQMAVLRADHPDIGRFAVCKRREGEFSNFNISVGVTDEFVEAVQNDESYTLYSPKTEFEEPFEVVNATVNFYSPSKQSYPETVVDENLWRDYADYVEAWDWENEETVPLREKWENDDRLELEEGQKMELPARFIWDLMVDGGWRNGEPGIFYLDEANREHSFDVEEHPEHIIEATNPCGEQPLSECEACNLGHINLSLMMKDDALSFSAWKEQEDYVYKSTKMALHDYLFENAVDWDRLKHVAQVGTRFLDNVVTMSDFPVDKIEERVANQRKIGLGVMGFAHMLYQMGIEYGSEESYHTGRIVMNFIDAQGTRASHELAKERGSFGYWEQSKYANPTEYPKWFKNHAHEDPENYPDGYEMRNHNITTVAPTGTTSMIGDTSGGIEPVYNVAYKKNVGKDIQGDTKLVEFDKVFLETLEVNGYDVEEIKKEAADQMDANEFDGVSSLPVSDEIKDIFVTTNDITPRQHGLMQRAFQAHNDSGISKTVNLPKEATHADVHDAYLLSVVDDELGSPSKGMTVYRDQSRMEQVLTTQENSDKEIEEAKAILEKSGYDVTKADTGGDE